MASAELDLRLVVEGCNNDTICQAEIGEDIGSCANDCTVIEPPYTPIPNTPTSPGVTTHGNTAWQYIGVKVNDTADSVTITWNTTRPTQSTFMWGLTDDYANGFVTEVGYVRDHLTKISNISAGKTYYFKITARDSTGVNQEYAGTFLLEKKTMIEPVQNVRSLKSYKSTVGIGLRWINPDIKDYSYTRVVRSLKNYPISPVDGKVVYEGGGSSFVDIGVNDNTPYYYAVFAKNTKGKYSSGVLLMATKYKNGVTPLESDKGSVYGKSPLNARQMSRGYNLPIERIDFTQEETKISLTGNRVPVRDHSPLTISIPKGDSKSGFWNEAFLLLTFTDKQKNPDAIYLLNLNPDNGRLEANIPTLTSDQSVAYSLQIFRDGSFHQLQSGVLEVSPAEKSIGNESASKSSKNLKDFVMILPISFLFFALLRLFKKI